MALRLALAGAAALALAIPSQGAHAQSDPAALDLIQRLRPQAGATRGIRMPSSAADTGAAAQPVQPAPIYSAPRAEPPRQTLAGPASPVARPAAASARTQAVARDTTATDGVAAANITVTFPSGSAALTPSAERQLAPLGQALASAELSQFRFRIEGHTDTVGSAALNQALSERRAQAVREFLVQRYNVPAERLQAVGHGQTQLLVPTADNVPEPGNRRVQVVNVGG